MKRYELSEEKRIQLDRMRYTKNSLSAALTYLAIVFNVLYFVSIYESDVGSWYYTILTGGSIVYNLVFMLVSFLASEGVKNYKIGYGYLLIMAGLMQIGRIFILPLRAYEATVTLKKVTYPVMQAGQFSYIVVLLCLSAVCAAAAGVIAVARTRRLNAYNASLADKSR